MTQPHVSSDASLHLENTNTDLTPILNKLAVYLRSQIISENSEFPKEETFYDDNLSLTGKSSNLTVLPEMKITRERMISNVIPEKMDDLKICLLVSGGVDSMVLLEVMSAFRLKGSLQVLHFNHGLRSVESDEDEEFVSQSCQKQNILFHSQKLNLPKGSGIQMKARQARKEWMLKLAQEHGWNVFVSAHHADDQLETILMRMKRGAGFQGLSGMQEIRSENNIHFFKPFLLLKKEELITYAQNKKITYREDSSNSSLKYFRNQIRHLEVPEIKKQFTNWNQDLASFNTVQWQQYRHTKIEAEKFLEGVSDNTVELEAYRGLQKDVRFFVLQHFLTKAGFKKQFTQKHFLEIDDLVEQKKSLHRQYGDVSFFLDKKNMCFEKAFSSASELWGGMILTSPGDYILEHIACQLTVKGGEYPMHVRFCRAGDRFCPASLAGHSQKLSDYFINHKVPRWRRSKIPLLVRLKKEVEVIVAVGDMGIAFGSHVDTAFQSKLQVSLLQVEL